jgi:hypothetical protein
VSRPRAHPVRDDIEVVNSPHRAERRSGHGSFDMLEDERGRPLIVSLPKDSLVHELEDREDDTVSLTHKGAKEGDEAAFVDRRDGLLILRVERDDRRVPSWSARGCASNHRAQVEPHKTACLRSPLGWFGERVDASHVTATMEFRRGGRSCEHPVALSDGSMFTALEGWPRLSRAGDVMKRAACEGV